ncbi:MAG: hypothetical protein HQK49_07890 [Oligoflexia bacterium]|nr:hypothetical protein [Oligoflexia bacterium]
MLRLTYIFALLFSLLTIQMISVRDLSASIIFEPFLAYTFGGNVDQAIDGTIFTWEYSAPTYGFRTGYYNTGFMVGVQFDLVTETWEGTGYRGADINDTSQELGGQNFGLFFGYQLVPPVRFWGNYYLSNRYNKKDDQGLYSRGDTYIGMGFSFGVGYAIWSFLAVNLEYRGFTFNQIKIATEKRTYNLDAGREIHLSEFLLSVSFPIIF